MIAYFSFQKNPFPLDRENYTGVGENGIFLFLPIKWKGVEGKQDSFLLFRRLQLFQILSELIIFS